MTDLATIDWRARARGLADMLASQGDLTDRAWHAGFAAVPRHLFVARFYRDDNSLVDSSNPAQQAEWLDAIYADETLVTQLAKAPGTNLQWPTSSSTAPGLMVRMLELLDVHDQHRALEIGTGTGYNAALLCHRLGDTNVASMDLHPDLIDQAQDRLAQLGYRPCLAAGDGAHGMPIRAPYDRIIATCGVATIPPAWIRQLANGGLIVADLRGEIASTLTRLRRINDTTVEGRLWGVPGNFMWLRTDPDNPLRDGGSLGTPMNIADGEQRMTSLDPGILDDPDFRMLWQLREPGIQHPWRVDRDGTELLELTGDDGSCAEVTTTATHNGQYVVTQCGQHRLWDDIERAASQWEDLGRPSRDRYGLTATTEGTQHYWLDHPASVVLVRTRAR